MTTYNSVSNEKKREQIYKCGWLCQTGYYAKTKRKGERGMREGWEYICFESCLNKIPKAKQVTTKEYNSGTKYPIISQEDKLISGYCDDESMLFHVDKPVIIFGDHTRVLKYIDFDFVVGADGVKIISPKENLNTKFLLYFLTWYNIPNLGYSRHYKLLKEIDIPVPPLSTQLSIVSELDKINELIRLKKEQLKDYDKLAQSLFYDIFGDPVNNEKGWNVKKLGDVCEVSSFKRVLVEDVLEKGPVPFIRGTELSAICKENKREYKMYITMEHYERVKNISGVPNVGDLLIPSINAEGLVWVVDTPEPMYYKDGRVLWVHVDQNSISPIALQRILNNLIKDNYSKITNGAVFAELNLSILRSFPIILPPLSIQNAFANKINLIEKQKAEIQSTIADLETLLASRMQYWFD